MIVVALVGEVDVATSPHLLRQLQALIDAGEVRVVVDMADVEFVDASGIGALVGAAVNARETGGGLALRRPSRSVVHLLDILQLESVLPVVA